MLDLRPATMADSEFLFAWRNDPETRMQSKSTALIPRSEHDHWMKLSVMMGYPQHLVMIVEHDNIRTGVVRFDADRDDVMAFRVSITIAPRHRGKRLAFGALAEAVRHMQEFTLHADIRRENAASRKIFERCGFSEVSSDPTFIKYRREPTS